VSAHLAFGVFLGLPDPPAGLLVFMVIALGYVVLD